MKKREVRLSGSEESTAFHRNLGLKSIVVSRKFVGECTLSPDGLASKMIPHQEMHEVQNGMSENTRAFSGRLARPDLVMAAGDFAGESNSQQEPVPDFLLLLEPIETPVGVVGTVANPSGSVGGSVSYTV
jgi:hypothetical protein